MSSSTQTWSAAQWNTLAATATPSATTPPPTQNAKRLVAELQQIRSPENKEASPPPTQSNMPELFLGAIVAYCLALIATAFTKSRR